MENRKDNLSAYSNLDILRIFDNCNSVSEIAHAGSIFLFLLTQDEAITDSQRFLVYKRMEIRKRQLK